MGIFWQSQAALILAVTVLVALLLFMEGLYLLWKSHHGPEARKISQRLDRISAAATPAAQAVLKDGQGDVSAWLAAWLPGEQRLSQHWGSLLMQADLRWPLSVFLLGSAALGLLAYGLVVTLAQQSAVVGALAALALGSVPLAYALRKRHLRLSQIERQLPEALDLMARALRAGHAFSSALQMVGEEMNEPIAGEFRVVHDEINYGVSLPQALAHLTARVPVTDLRYVVVAVLIQRESGGNLTEVLSKLGDLIRQRLRLLARVRVLSSEGRLSAWILGLMPFILGGLMAVFNPDFMRPLWTDPIGIAIVKYLLGLMLVGVLLLLKIVRIRV